MVDQILNAMDTYNCGRNCVYTNPYAFDPSPCGNRDYYYVLIGYANCNATTSTVLSSTSTST
jgi:hypothetical protein